MLPKGQEVAARTKLTMVEMIRWARQEFNLPNFSVGYQLTSKSDRSWCKSGFTESRLQIGVESLMKKEVIAFPEYRSFNNYMEVGGFKTTDWRLYLDAILAHEVSHAVQYELIRKAIKDGAQVRRRLKDVSYYVEGLGYTEGGHGSFFLAIYKRFRNRFINPSLTRADYTAPRTAFELAETITNGDHPLAGVAFKINGKTFTVLGKDEATRRQYAYKGKCNSTGTVYGVKLIDIARDAVAAEIIANNPALRAELAMLQAKTTRRTARRSFGW